jgi:hypothetical protein
MNIKKYKNILVFKYNIMRREKGSFQREVGIMMEGGKKISLLLTYSIIIIQFDIWRT